MSIFAVGGSMLGMVLMMTLVWIGLMSLLIWGVTHSIPYERRTDNEVAREALGRRYAAGELTEAEYLRALHTLRCD